jgi:hypothetical protein
METLEVAAAVVVDLELIYQDTLLQVLHYHCLAPDLTP